VVESVSRLGTEPTTGSTPYRQLAAPLKLIYSCVRLLAQKCLARHAALLISAENLS
jgi:hypothetical protein